MSDKRDGAVHQPSIFDPRRAIRDFTYKPGWVFSVAGSPPYLSLQVEAMVQDLRDLTRTTRIYMQAVLPYHHLMDEEDFLIRVECLVRDLESHETDGWLRYKGKHVREPHP